MIAEKQFRLTENGQKKYFNELFQYLSPDQAINCHLDHDTLLTLKKKCTEVSAQKFVTIEIKRVKRNLSQPRIAVKTEVKDKQSAELVSQLAEDVMNAIEIDFGEKSEGKCHFFRVSYIFIIEKDAGL